MSLAAAHERLTRTGMDETAHDPESEVHQNIFWCALMRMDSASQTNHPILQRTEVSIPQRITNLLTWSRPRKDAIE